MHLHCGGHGWLLQRSTLGKKCSAFTKGESTQTGVRPSSPLHTPAVVFFFFSFDSELLLTASHNQASLKTLISGPCLLRALLHLTTSPSSRYLTLTCVDRRRPSPASFLQLDGLAADNRHGLRRFYYQLHHATNITIFYFFIAVFTSVETHRHTWKHLT